MSIIHPLRKDARQQKQKTMSERTTKQLLGEIYNDKEYLEKLLKDECKTCLWYIFQSFISQQYPLCYFVTITYCQNDCITSQIHLISYVTLFNCIEFLEQHTVFNLNYEWVSLGLPQFKQIQISSSTTS